MKKVIAGLMTALLAIVPIVSAVELGNYPAFLAEDGQLDALVVIGSTADVGDVVGAVDIAARLAETGASETETACAGASGAVTGTEKDTVGLQLGLKDVFPSSGNLKSAHYSMLKDSTISWKGSSYDYREELAIGEINMSHDLSVSNVNGTEKMIVESGDVVYKYVFEKQLNITSANDKGSISNPDYTNAVKIQLLGEDFSIVGVGSGTVKMLYGSSGTATATSPIVYGDYSIYADLGESGATGWVRVRIEDAEGNEVETMYVDNGNSKDAANVALTIQLTAVKALQDGTVAAADLVVGPSEAGVSKTYDVTADVTTTDEKTSDRFPGETDWGIEVTSGSFDAAQTGLIEVGDTIEVVYKPTTTQYLVAGEKVELPNSYGEIAFEGWNTDKFDTITVEAANSALSAYNYSADTQAFGDLRGIKITSEQGSIVSNANTGYKEAYILFNKSVGHDVVPVFVGFKDEAKSKILVNGTIAAVGADCPSSEFVSKILNMTEVGKANATVTYKFQLSYGNAADTADIRYMNVTIGGAKMVTTLTVGTSTSASSIVIGMQNKTAPTTANVPEFKLGKTAADTETGEINATTHGTTRVAGRKSQEVVDDSGIIILPTQTHGGSERVAFKLPFQTLKAKVYVGTKGEGVSGDTIAYTSYPSIPISSAIAKLDTELSEADKAKNLIAVGGPAVNMISAEALGFTELTFGQAAADALGIAEGQGAIVAEESPYAAGKTVMVVAGWDVAATRAASTALQQFDTMLVGVTDASYVVG